MIGEDPRQALDARAIGHFHDLALALADAARRRLRELSATDFEVKRKPDGSYVTSADVDIERALRALIQTHFPEHGIVGEELPAHAPQSEYQWILDPIDGTEDFVQRMPTFGTIIALHYRGWPLVGISEVPLLGLRVHAAYDQGAFDDHGRIHLPDLPADTSPAHTRILLPARANFISHGDDGRRFDAVTRHYPNQRIYRSCYAHLCVVRGQVDGMVEYGNKVWDLAAVQILIEEAGGAFKLVQQLNTPSGLVLGAAFGKPSLVARLATLIEET